MARIREGVRLYGCWAGQPHGTAENPTRCIEEVLGNDRWEKGHQCNFKRGHGPDGLYCKLHAPETRAAKQAESDRKYAVYQINNRITGQGRQIVIIARDVFKQADTYENLERAVAALESLIVERDALANADKVEYES